VFFYGPSQESSSLSEFTSLRVPAGGVPIAKQHAVSITSLTLVLSIPQKFVVHDPYDRRRRYFTTAHLQRVLTGMRLLY